MTMVMTMVIVAILPVKSIPSILRINPPEFLDALPGVDLGGVDIALPVDRDVMQRGELPDLPAGSADARQRLLAQAIDNADFTVHPVDHVDELLVLVGREHEIVDRAGAERRFLEHMLGNERAVLAEHLHPVVGAVADIDEPVLVDADAMPRIAELARRGLRRIVFRLPFVTGLFAVGAPMTKGSRN